MQARPAQGCWQRGMAAGLNANGSPLRPGRGTPAVRERGEARGRGGSLSPERAPFSPAVPADDTLRSSRTPKMAPFGGTEVGMAGGDPWLSRCGSLAARCHSQRV